MKAKLIKQLKSIVNIPADRVFYDVPDSLMDEMFDTYDPSDLYMYLTQKERNAAYKDLRSFPNAEQIQKQWKKQAVWRAAKAACWDDGLFELDEAKLTEGTMTDWFDKNKFMSYLSSEFSLDNFSRSLVDNIIEYGLEHESDRDDQFAYFLADILPEVDFGEVAAFCADYVLTDDGNKKRASWMVMHPDVKEFISESKSSVMEEILNGGNIREVLSGSKEE